MANRSLWNLNLDTHWGSSPCGRAKDFYASLAQFPAAESVEDWFEGDVIDALVVMPSKGLTLEEILSSSD